MATRNEVCSACGARLHSGAKFCTTCGKPAEPITTGDVCSACGARLRPEAKFCIACGEATQPKKTAPSVTKKAKATMASASATAGEAKEVLGTADQITSLAQAVSGKPSFDVVVGEMLPSLTVAAGQVIIEGARGVVEERAKEHLKIPPHTDQDAPHTESPTPPPTQKPDAATAHPPIAAYCSRCGHPAEADKKSCGMCGAPTTRNPPLSKTPTCPRCQSPVHSNSQFCGTCGSPVGGDVAEGNG